MVTPNYPVFPMSFAPNVGIINFDNADKLLDRTRLSHCAPDAVHQIASGLVGDF